MAMEGDMHRTRIKVCGITRLEDAMLAVRLGVDALGFVFYERSPRFVPPPHAASIIRALPPFVSAVGLFVNPTQEEIDATLAQCPLDVVQLHGDETPEFCEAQQRRVIKALHVAGPEDLKMLPAYDCAVLLDAKAPDGVWGGAGRSFDWSLLEGVAHDHALLLAGGLNADNVGAALAIRQWDAVDVSSGVEAMPGLKDADKLRRFVRAVRAAGRDAGSDD